MSSVDKPDQARPTDVSGQQPMLQVVPRALDGTLPEGEPGADLPVPERVGQRVDLVDPTGTGARLVCHEPGRWLALLPEQDSGLAFHGVATTAGADLVDVTWQWARFIVPAACAELVWSTGTAMPTSALVGGAAVGRFADLRAVLVAASPAAGSPADGFEIWVPAGYRGYLALRLTEQLHVAALAERAPAE